MPGKDIGSPCDTAQCSVGEPISVATGNVFYDALDFETAGQNKLSFVRYYNSRIAFSGGLGTSWRHNYERALLLTLDGNSKPSQVDAERADGQKITFVLSGGNWITDSDIDVALTQSGSTWKLRDEHDAIETYVTDAAGDTAFVTSIEARNGYTQNVAYNSLNRVTSVTDSYGRMLAFTYSGAQIQTLTTPDGQIFTYAYDSSFGNPSVNNRLKSVTYSTNPATSQTYSYEVDINNPMKLTGVTDENGVIWQSWTYDVHGRGLSGTIGTGANANTTSIIYNDTDRSRVVINALGQQETYKFTVLQGAPKIAEIDRIATATTAPATRHFTYDSNGYLATVTDWNGSSTHHTNDVHGQPLTVMEAYGTPQARTTTITYDTTHVHVPVAIVTSGLTTSLALDPQGNPLTKTLTDTTTTSTPYSTHGQTRTWTYTWSSTGQLLSVKKPRTDITAKTLLAYNPDGSLHTITDALGHVTTVGLHNGASLPTQVIDPNGVYRFFAYNPRLRLITDTLATSLGYPSTIYTYDAALNLLSTMLPDTSIWKNTFDTAHRPTQLTDHDGNSVGYTLDAVGNHTHATTKDFTGTITRQHSATFDALGRKRTDVGGAGQTTTLGYDNNGNATSITDPLNHTTTQVFDPLNRLAESTNAAGGVTQYSYDVHDRPLTVTAPNGAVTAYVYDGFGDLIQQSSPDSGVTVYHYDPDRNLALKVDATTAVMNQTFDALDRPLTTTYPADSTLNVTRHYDEAGHGKGIGRLTSLTDAAGTLNRSYDERGNITVETRVSGGHTLKTSYGYDNNGNTVSITYPSGWTVAYTRDYETRIAVVKAKAPGASTYQTVAGNIPHMPFGPFKYIDFSNGLRETPTYDLAYRMTNIWDAAGASTIQNFAYYFDAADNVTRLTDYITPGNSQTFGYDPLNRLTTANGNYGPLSWVLDHNGNRTQQTASGLVTNYTLVANSNRLASITNSGTTQSVAYTAAGDMTTIPANLLAATASYNKAGQMATIVTPSSSASYKYDFLGQRIVKVRAGSQTAYYTYGQSGEVLEENDFYANPTDYVYMDGRPIALLQGTYIFYLHTDRLGTPQLATDGNKTIVWSGTFRPFGTSVTLSGSIIQNLRFPGQFFDAESQLENNGARVYIPQLGRYMKPDPTGLAGGTNTYIYANANPAKFIDPLGLVCGDFWYALAQLMGLAPYPSSDASGNTLNNAPPSDTADQPQATAPDSNEVQKPDGIPDNWVEQPTDTPGGKQWVNPDNTNDRVRSMPGNPDSANPWQQQPYVVDQNGGYRDVNGNSIPGAQPGKTQEAHIPTGQYKFRRP